MSKETPPGSNPGSDDSSDPVQDRGPDLSPTPCPCTTSSKVPLPVEITGWVGTVLIVLAYGLTSHGAIPAGTLYQVMNLAGAGCVAWLCWHKRTWQPLALQLVWMAIATVAIITGSAG